MCKKSSWVGSEQFRKMSSEGWIRASVFTLKAALTKWELLANSDRKYLASYLIALQKQKASSLVQRERSKTPKMNPKMGVTAEQQVF